MAGGRAVLHGIAVPTLALALHVMALASFGLAFDGYSHRTHPVALLGARGVPGAGTFNLLAFVVPGLLCVLCAWRLRQAEGDWRQRIGSQALLLSALAFAAQGLWPLDPTDLDAPASRLHAALWMAWVLASTVGAALLASAPAWPARMRGWAAALAFAIPVFALLGASFMPAAVAQRAAYLCWLVGWIALAWVSRGAVSVPGSSPPARS